jgi:hypothetical protein
MLARSGALPTDPDWLFEPKWDGFRAIVSTEDDSGFAVAPWLQHDGGLARAARASRLALEA